METSDTPPTPPARPWRDPHALAAPAQPGWSDQRDRSDADTDWASDTRHPTWRALLTRWLLTLNSGRTQVEYEKAARYFFETPGVPQETRLLTYDLLLAYRGALALRADRRRSRPRRAATGVGPRWRIAGDGSTLEPNPTLGSGGPNQAQGAPQRDLPPHLRPASLRQGPLSPATVNIRLTALRQFLLYAHEQDALPQLTPDRVHSALRRLRAERRRPYQILAEEEWGEFLQAARSILPAPLPSGATPDAPASPSPTPRGPWGVTRAGRAERVAQGERAAEVVGASGDAEGSEEALAAAGARAHDGRTGARTAQRDHALIALALATGLRAIELSLLDVGDLTCERRKGQEEWWLALPDEKTKGQHGGRALPLAPDLVATLLAYLRATGRAWERAADRETPLFLALSRGRPPSALADLAQGREVSRTQAQGEPTPHLRRLRPEQIRGVINRVEEQWQAARAARDAAEGRLVGEARRISPHALRHSAAIALLLGNDASERPPASVEHVRGWLGHFDIRTTQRYLAHLESREQRRRFVISPLATPETPQQATQEAPQSPYEAGADRDGRGGADG